MPVSQIYKHAAVFSASEQQEGVSPAILATSVVQTSGWTFDMQDDTITLDTAHAGDPLNSPELSKMRTAKIGMEIPYAYSGAAGEASALAPLFKASGATATEEEGVSITYDRASISTAGTMAAEIRMPKSATKDYRYRSTGMRGTVGFDVEAGGMLSFKFDFQGNYFLPDEVNLLEGDAGSQRTNLINPATSAAVYAKSLGGDPLCLLKVSCDNFFGFAVKRLLTMCGEESGLEDAAGKITVTYKQVDFTEEFNPWYIGDRTTIKRLPFEFGIGMAAGKKIRFAVDEVQPGLPKLTKLENGGVGVEQELLILRNPRIIEE